MPRLGLTAWLACYALPALLFAWPVGAQQPAAAAGAADPRIARLVADAQALRTEPACRALIGHAAALALGEPSEAAALATYGLAEQAMRRCPDAPFAAYWQRVADLAETMGRSDPPVPERSLGRRIKAHAAPLPPMAEPQNLFRGCKGLLRDAIEPYLTTALGYPRRDAAAKLGRYVLFGCPSAELRRTWPTWALFRQRARAALAVLDDSGGQARECEAMDPQASGSTDTILLVPGDDDYCLTLSTRVELGVRIELHGDRRAVLEVESREAGQQEYRSVSQGVTRYERPAQPGWDGTDDDAAAGHTEFTATVRPAPGIPPQQVTVQLSVTFFYSQDRQ